MKIVMDWLNENKDWFFSGAGVTILLYFFFNKAIYKTIKNVWQRIANSIKWHFRKRHMKDRDHDDSMFVSESPADGITKKVGEVLVKSWTIMNNGNVIWKNRTLQCVEYVDGLFYPEKMILKIPTTYPGQKRTFTVKYVLKGTGDFHSKWKMYDENNQLIYPNKRLGLGVNISVRP